MALAQYASLRRAELSIDYLHTNSTTHEFLFGALAELLDNSRDADATRIDIYTVACPSVRGKWILCFLDDGEGMTPDDSAKVIQFGYSGKRARNSKSIGQYGNGLKSGAMRIGRDFILFTKRESTMTCVFLSRSFHEEEGITQVIVPMPSWSLPSRQPLVATNDHDKRQHQVEVDIITRFSPFKTEADILAQFDKIEGNSGTLVMIYNLRLGDNADTELDFTTSPDDILMDSRDPQYADTESGMKPELRSFRAYSAILYYDPSMKIYIQGKKVRTKRLMDVLHKPRMYHFTSKRFKTRMEAEVKKAREDAKQAEQAAREAESDARDAESKQGRSNQARAVARNAQAIASRAGEMSRNKALRAEAMEKSLREPKTLDFVFGINIGNRSQDGLFVYNCSRLIKMFEAPWSLTYQANRDQLGVVGLVNVPYMVLEPTHNKQDFADAKEFRHLTKAMGDHLAQYWRDVDFEGRSARVQDMWSSFGYRSWESTEAQDDMKFRRKRAMQLLDWVQCDSCCKWRQIPYSVRESPKPIPLDWTCSQNPDPSRKRCSDPEQKKDFPIGQLQRPPSVDKTVSDVDRKRRRAEDVVQEPPPAKRQAVSRNSSTSTPPTTPSGIAPSIVPQRRAALDASRKLQQSESTRLYQDEPSAVPEPDPPRRASANARPAAAAAAAAAGVDGDAEDGRPPIRRRTVAIQQHTPTRSNPRTTAAAAAAAAKTSANVRSPASRGVTTTSQSLVGGSSRASMSPVSAAASPTAAAAASVGSPAGDAVPPLHCDQYPLNAQVEARINGRWFAATVVKYSLAKDTQELRVKVKFEENSNDKYDKHFSVTSSDLRLLVSNGNGVGASNEGHGVGESADVVPGQAAAMTDSERRTATEVANNFRTSLQYFLPPTWHMPKERLGELTPSELASFPITEFFDQYEAYLNRLVEEFKTESADEKRSVEGQLMSLRRNVAKLLRSIRESHGEENQNDGDDVSEKVDQLLEEVVRASEGI